MLPLHTPLPYVTMLPTPLPRPSHIIAWLPTPSPLRELRNSWMAPNNELQFLTKLLWTRMWNDSRFWAPTNGEAVAMATGIWSLDFQPPTMQCPPTSKESFRDSHNPMLYYKTWQDNFEDSDQPMLYNKPWLDNFWHRSLWGTFINDVKQEGEGDSRGS